MKKASYRLTQDGKTWYNYLDILNKKKTLTTSNAAYVWMDFKRSIESILIQQKIYFVDALELTECNTVSISVGVNTRIIKDETNSKVKKFPYRELLR